MKNHIRDILNSENELYNYLIKNQMADDLEAEIRALEDICEDYQAKIDEAANLNEEKLANFYCKQFQKYDKKRIRLALERNRIENELLTFELNRYAEE